MIVSDKNLIQFAAYGAWISLSIFLMWNVLVIGNLLDAAVCGPGYVPKEWSPDDENDTKKVNMKLFEWGFGFFREM